MKGARKHLPYFTAEEIKQTYTREVHDVLTGYLSDAAEAGLQLVEIFHPPSIRAKTRLLDCGTASGLFTQALYRIGFRDIFATDIADYRPLEIKASSVIKEFHPRDLSYEHLPWADGFFDAVTAWEIVEHLENPHHFIREVHRCLKPHGLFFLAMPNVISLRSRKKFLWHGEVDRYTEGNNHITLFTRSIFTKTILRYFNLLTHEYRADPKIYLSRFGWLKKLGFSSRWAGQKKFAEWFGSDVLYVLRRKIS